MLAHTNIPLKGHKMIWENRKLHSKPFPYFSLVGCPWWWWGLTSPKQLSMAATAQVIWLCACIRYSPYYGVASCEPIQLPANIIYRNVNIAIFKMCCYFFSKHPVVLCKSWQRYLCKFIQSCVALMGFICFSPKFNHNPIIIFQPSLI